MEDTFFVFSTFFLYVDYTERMKRIRIFLIIFLIAGISLPSLYTMGELGFFSSGPKVQIHNTVTDPDAPVLRVVADYDFCPYSFSDENGDVTGLDVELINEITNRLGMKVDITFDTWQVCKKRLQDGQADIILGLEIFSHMEGVKKTLAVSEDQLIIFGKQRINNIAALQNKRVGLMVNNVIERIFDLNCEFVSYFTNTQILEAIESGEIDFGICHGSVGKKIVEKAGWNLVTSAVLMESYPAIGVREDLVDLRDRINTIIVQLSDEGFINRLDEKWLVNFVEKRTLREVLQLEATSYLIYGIFFLLMLVFILFVYRDSYYREKADAKNMEYQANLKRKNDLLVSVAGVYHTMVSINIPENTHELISCQDSELNFFSHSGNAREQVRETIENGVITEDVELALNFSNLTTLPSRMQDKNIILAEFRGKNIGWFCLQFIAVARDENGAVTEVILTRQNIDEMKKEKERLLKLSSYDELTMLYNRHAYEEKVREYMERNICTVGFMVFDITGLKSVNDTYGHSAGDELICGGAGIIKETFGEVGVCCRTGGDEFMVIMEQKPENFGQIVENFKNKLASWRGVQIQQLNVAFGAAFASDMENFTVENYKALMEMADHRMYEDKAEYYRKRGIERRR